MKQYLNVRNLEVHIGFIILLCVILILSSALAVIYYTKTIDHQASIVSDGSIQTYSDSGCTTTIDSNNWGNFNTTSGDHTKMLEVYIKNEGNVKVNVTWTASSFTTYNVADSQFETSSWRLYLVDGSEVRLKPENDTAPDKVTLLAGEVAHLKFYLAAIEGSTPENLTFRTTFKSQDT